jgi:hypothetical protein
VNGWDSHGPGAPVEVYPCEPNAGDAKLDEEWTYVPAADVADGRTGQLMNRASGLCLGVPGWDDNMGQAGLEVYHCGALPNSDQHWSITPAPTMERRLLERYSGRCLGLDGGDAASSGSALRIKDCDVSPSVDGKDLSWSLYKLPGAPGYYQLRSNVPAGYVCLGVVGGAGHAYRAGIEIHACDERALDQQWRPLDFFNQPVEGFEGLIRLQNRAQGDCLGQDSMANGSPLRVKECASGARLLAL